MITARSEKTAPNRVQIRALYNEAFPKNERLPWWLLRLWATWKRGDLTAYYYGDAFLGFTFSVTVQEAFYVMFFAVAKELRGQGCGTAILEHIKQQNADKTIFLVAEPLEKSAPNYLQRQRRLAFYEKNGFHDTGCNGREVGGMFCVLSTTGTIDEKTYRQVFQKLTFGLWRPRLVKVRPSAQERETI